MDSPTNDGAPGAGCGCVRQARAVKWATAGGLLAAVGVCAACCLLPFALMGVGVAGVWVSALDAFAPYKWAFIAAAVAALGYGFYAAYWKPKRSCQAGAGCKVCGSSRSTRLGLWIATFLVVAGIGFEQVEPHLTR